jgi:hypothetical protein
MTSCFQTIGDAAFGGDVFSVDGRAGVVTLADLYQNLSEKGVANGYASLDSDGKLPTSQLPPLSITSVFVVASEAEQLALTVQEGDVAIRTDESKSYIALNDVNASLSDWQELLSPTTGVISVDGKTGVVDLSGDYVGLTGNQSVGGEKTFSDKIIVDELTIDGDSIASNQVNGDIQLIPAGTGGINDGTPLADTRFRIHNAGDTASLDQAQNNVPAQTIQSTFWQSFTAGAYGFLDTVSLNRSGSPAAGQVLGTVEIRAGEGTGGTLLASTTFDTSDTGWLDFDFSSPTIVLPGVQYTMVFTITGGPGQFYHKYDNTNSYAGGRYSLSASWDMAFRTEVRPILAEFVIKSDTGFAGFGTNAPSERLEVLGNMKLSGDLGATSSRVTKGWFEELDADGDVRISGIDFTAASRKVSLMGATEQDGNANFKENFGPWWTDDGTSSGIFRFTARANSAGTLFLIGFEATRATVSSSQFRVALTDVNTAFYVIGGITTEGNLNVQGDRKFKLYTNDVSNPPTDAELDAIFGTPATVGANFTAEIDDAGAGNNFYSIKSDGSNWWITTWTKAV